MAFKLTNGEWLARHTKAAGSVFRQHLTKGQYYTPGELKTVLETQTGLSFTEDQFNEIRAVLVEDGILEEGEAPE
jgi:hypothetical protein